MKKLTTLSTTVILGLGLALSHAAMAQADEVTESTAPVSYTHLTLPTTPYV